jgi:uncharacterized protein (TIGR02246 family)
MLMKRTGLTVFAMAATLLGACSRSPRVDLAAEEKAVRDVSTHWLDLIKEHDAAGEAALFTDDGVMYRAHSEPAVGPAAIEAYETRDQAANPKMVVEWTTDAVSVAASGDMAVETGTYRIANAGPKGSGEDRGEFVTVYRKVNGQWKISRDVGSSTIAEAKPAAPKVQVASRARTSAKPKPRTVAHAPRKAPPKSRAKVRSPK